MVLFGITLLAIGFAILVLDIYRTAPTTWWLPILSALSLRFIARPLRAVIFGLIGVLFIIWGMWGLNRSLLLPFVRPGKQVIDTVTAYRRKEKGPRIVVIGGGTGLSSLLRGIKNFSNNITAIVTVADDGGSSGELRKNIGILPPGDIRNCLTALSSDEEMMAQIFQYRFAEGAGLNGHSLGNLFITALTDLTGSFEEAIAETGRVLAVQGRVLPATLHDVTLVADINIPSSKKKQQIRGESKISQTEGKVEKIWLEPRNPLAFPPALQAILSADLILVGPGSLYTSILPNLLVSDLTKAISASQALKFYICNVATQQGETDGYSSFDHISTLEKYIGSNLFDLVICNQRINENLPDDINWVVSEPELEERYAVYSADLLDEENPWRHNSEKLARVLLDLYMERTGPLMDRSNDFDQ
ncbi:MAG: uridine diphosphate-N-acetylglucosamine-binding protein YvcK [Anaerolineaceae bacterium]|nr:uridine diphosphate-N-acetylglucosamine-binding protein YvcK [Anaerolineaceae bacterium]